MGERRRSLPIASDHLSQKLALHHGSIKRRAGTVGPHFFGSLLQRERAAHIPQSPVSVKPNDPRSFLAMAVSTHDHPLQPSPSTSCVQSHWLVLRQPLEPRVYTSTEYAQLCAQLGVTQSLGAFGTSASNSLAESFNVTVKREVLQDKNCWPDEATCRRHLFRGLVRYNSRRRHSWCGYRSPSPIRPSGRGATPPTR